MTARENAARAPEMRALIVVIVVIQISGRAHAARGRSTKYAKCQSVRHLPPLRIIEYSFTLDVRHSSSSNNTAQHTIKTFSSVARPPVQKTACSTCSLADVPECRFDFFKYCRVYLFMVQEIPILHALGARCGAHFAWRHCTTPTFT